MIHGNVINGNATALVAGSGPNGLAAAIRLAQAGVNVTVHEAAAIAGGAARTAQLTLPGFEHDLGSAIHPMAVTSPFFATLPLREHGLEWGLAPGSTCSSIRRWHGCPD